MLLIVGFHANLTTPMFVLTLSRSALSGAFGSGAAFAFEDAYVLAQALAYTHSRDENISEALKLYDEVRYARSMPSSTALQTLQVKCKSLMARRMKTNLSERPLDATGLPTKIGSIPTMSVHFSLFSLFKY